MKKLKKPLKRRVIKVAKTSILDKLTRDDRIQLNSFIKQKVKEKIDMEMNSAEFMHILRKLDEVERAVKGLDTAYREIMKYLWGKK